MRQIVHSTAAGACLLPKLNACCRSGGSSPRPLLKSNDSRPRNPLLQDAAAYNTFWGISSSAGQLQGGGLPPNGWAPKATWVGCEGANMVGAKGCAAVALGPGSTAGPGACFGAAAKGGYS
jgi:hypothetical protein